MCNKLLQIEHQKLPTHLQLNGRCIVPKIKLRPRI